MSAADPCDAYDSGDCGRCHTLADVGLLGEYDDIYCIAVCASSGERCKRKAVRDQLKCKQHADMERAAVHNAILQDTRREQEAEQKHQDPADERLRRRTHQRQQRAAAAEGEDNVTMLVRLFDKYCDHNITEVKPLATQVSIVTRQRPGAPRYPYFRALYAALKSDLRTVMYALIAKYEGITVNTIIDMHLDQDEDMYVNPVIVYDRLKLDIAVMAMQAAGIAVADTADVLAIVRRRNAVSSANDMDVIHVVFGDALKPGIRVSDKVRHAVQNILALSSEK